MVASDFVIAGIPMGRFSNLPRANGRHLLAARTTGSSTNSAGSDHTVSCLASWSRKPRIGTEAEKNPHQPGALLRFCALGAVDRSQR
jgi:hypothetical protein